MDPRSRPGCAEGNPFGAQRRDVFPESERPDSRDQRRHRRSHLEYRRPLPEDVNEFFPTPTANRNNAIYGDRIIDTSVDNFVFGLDSATGKLAFETRIADYRELSAQQTAGPIVANGKIISGRGCEPRGAADACVITDHDAKTGKELWRTRPIPKLGEPGSETWATRHWNCAATSAPGWCPATILS